MVDVKLIIKEAPFKRYRKTTFLYVLEENKPLICSKCLKPIEEDIYVYLCSDKDKIWHELCIDEDHHKTMFKSFGTLKQHSDWLCLVRYLNKELFNAFGEPVTELHI